MKGQVLEHIRSFGEREGICMDERVMDRFAVYIETLLQWNRNSNLIGRTDRMAFDLFIDSLQLLQFAEIGTGCAEGAAIEKIEGPLLDVGSGAGFPGLPLAICAPQLEVTLVEPRRHRALFLDRVVFRMNLPNVRVEPCRCEELASTSFATVISKAFKPPLEWIRTGARFLSKGGTLVVMTTPEAWTRETEEAVQRTEFYTDAELVVRSRVNYRNRPEAPARTLVFLNKR